MIRPPTVHKPRLRFYIRVTGLYFEQRKVEREMHEKMMEKMKANGREDENHAGVWCTRSSEARDETDVYR